jgi:predicted MFS family arabinose efflux permease
LVGSTLLLLYAFGPVKPLTVGLLALAGLGFSALAAAVQGRTLQLAPGNTDVASAGVGSAFNAGIASGSLLGGALLPSAGARPLTLVGGLLALAALSVALFDARRHPGPAKGPVRTAVEGVAECDDDQATAAAR